MEVSGSYPNRTRPINFSLDLASYCRRQSDDASPTEIQQMSNLLVIDDEPLTLECFRLLFPKGQVNVMTAESAAEGVALFRGSRPDVAVLDVRLPDASGLETFRQFREIDAKVPVVLVTGYGTAGTAIEAMRLGAYDYLLKPLDSDRTPRPGRAGVRDQPPDARAGRMPVRGTSRRRADVLIGRSPAMQEVYKAIGRVAPQDVTVLILGESGTGKELVARAIYHHSRRADSRSWPSTAPPSPRRCWKASCSATRRARSPAPTDGASASSSSATAARCSSTKSATCRRSTQSKVLRVLQDRVRTRRRKRDDHDRRARHRRHQPRPGENGRGRRFRSDLYYRLNGFTIQLAAAARAAPRISAAVGKLPDRSSARSSARTSTACPPEAMEVLWNYTWPGNVRELQNVLKQAILHATGPSLRPEFLPHAVRGEPSLLPATEQELSGLTAVIRMRLAAGSTDLHAEIMSQIERSLLLEVLKYMNFNLFQAARTLGISRTTLRAKMSALGLALERSTSLETPRANPTSSAINSGTSTIELNSR